LMYGTDRIDKECVLKDVKKNVKIKSVGVSFIHLFYTLMGVVLL
jgi:hypothetical protein